jgi:hypothetical protein
MGGMPTSALYYPWMHFQDDEWVKRSLLTWDSLVRVRAKDVDDRDSDLVRQVRAETGFLKEISPSRRDLWLMDAAFGEVLDNSQKRLVERYRTDVRGNEENWAAVESNTIATDRDDLTWIYCGPAGSKVYETLRDKLVDSRLAQADGGWLGMRPKLASIYLATLADVIAAGNLLSPVTDDLRMHRAVGALDRLSALLLDEPVEPALEDPTSAYIHVALDAVIVPADVPVAKLIRFRDKHSADLTAFREHVAGLGDELRQVATVENLEIVHAHLESLYRKHTKPQLDELRRALRGLGVESTAGSLGLKVDAAAGTIAGSIAAAGGQLAVAGTAIALSVIPYLAGRYKAATHLRRNSPVAYLLAAGREL